MSAWRIPFNRPTLLGSEFDYMRMALESGRLSGGGAFSARAEKTLERQVGAARVLLTPSGTAALEMAALLLRLQPGGEVIVPSFTFVSTANAFYQFGARIVFADIRPDTLNIDERQVRQLITPRTRAIVAVHYAGVGADMKALLDFNVPVIEDNAHGLFGRSGNKPLGSFGSAAATSFHETKSFTCGEGGALILNQPAWIERAEILREKGTNRNQFFLGQVDKYTWVDRGSSYLPSELSAAFLLAQLERCDEVQTRRRILWERYARELEGWACASAVRLPYIPADCDQAFHMFYLLLPSNEARNRLIAHLAARGILAVFHYVPLDSSPAGREAGVAPLGCPVTADISARLVRLPFFTGLSEEDQTEVIRAVREFSP
ncbi:MAG TPA: dTDP-4-amino-4,6-dideoxygalactose transaminase [Bryobacteraceae bacterium]|jgi:dTDP-4-amino-4,6-dideoxygalactose transaminase|nr:dTDP-4-amino-4,6-dideoxygalactose transaminase [Bryobacteraceae bacterium]